MSTATAPGRRAGTFFRILAYENSDGTLLLYPNEENGIHANRRRRSGVRTLLVRGVRSIRRREKTTRGQVPAARGDAADAEHVPDRLGRPRQRLLAAAGGLRH